MNKTVMAIVAHPDDEVFGCGGTLVKHADAGDKVIIVTLTDGCSARASVKKENLLERQLAIKSVCQSLSAKLICFDFDDNKMDKYPLLDIVKAIEPLINDYMPRRIYTHHHGDLNIDHSLCHQAVITACRPQRGCPVLEILAFEVSSATGWNTPITKNAFIPNVFIDISTVFEKKIALLDFYQEELRAYPHIRSKEALIIKDKYRGSEVGLYAAEAFFMLRQIEH